MSRVGIGQIKRNVSWRLYCKCESCLKEDTIFFQRFPRTRVETSINPNTGRENNFRFSITRAETYDKALEDGWKVKEGSLVFPHTESFEWLGEMGLDLGSMK